MRQLTEFQVMLYTFLFNALTIGAALGTHLSLKGEEDWLQWGAACAVAFAVWAVPVLIMYRMVHRRFEFLVPIASKLSRVNDGLFAVYCITVVYCSGGAAWNLTNGAPNWLRLAATTLGIIVGFFGPIILAGKIERLFRPSQPEPE